MNWLSFHNKLVREDVLLREPFSTSTYNPPTCRLRLIANVTFLSNEILLVKLHNFLKDWSRPYATPRIRITRHIPKRGKAVYKLAFALSGARARRFFKIFLEHQLGFLTKRQTTFNLILNEDNVLQFSCKDLPALYSSLKTFNNTLPFDYFNVRNKIILILYPLDPFYLSYLNLTCPELE